MNLATRRRICLVHGDITIVENTKGILEDAGYDVRTLESTETLAKEILRFGPDLVLLDVKKTRYQIHHAVEIVKASGVVRGTRVVAFSTGTDQELEDIANACGLSGYVPADRDPDEFKETLAALLAQG
jgi:DNA-binding response OmpR family regulator